MYLFISVRGPLITVARVINLESLLEISAVTNTWDESWEIDMIGDFKVGLTGNDFELLDSVFVTGNQDDFYEILSYTISETVVWIDVPGWMELQFINVQLFFGNFISLEIDINPDWNLIGLPLTTTDPSVAFLYPDAIDGTLFGFRDTYFLIDSLTNGALITFPSKTIANLFPTFFFVASPNL